MVHKTSWTGTYTRDLRSKGMRGGYVRYNDRSRRTGLQVVRNKEFANYVYAADGKTLLKIEPKYKNFNSNDTTAKRTYNRDIKSHIKLLEKQAKFKNKIVRHGD